MKRWLWKHEGREFIAYAETHADAVARLQPMSAELRPEDVTETCAPEDEERAPMIDNRRAPGT